MLGKVKTKFKLFTNTPVCGTFINKYITFLTFSGIITTSAVRSTGLKVGSIHSSQYSKCFLSIQCSDSSTSWPFSPCTEYQYKYSTPLSVSLRMVSTYIFSPSRVTKTSFIFSFRKFNHSSTFSVFPSLTLNLVSSTFILFHLSLYPVFSTILITFHKIIIYKGSPNYCEIGIDWL